LRGIVTAIRHSEEADRFYEAGLTTRAVAMYQEALTHFEDAYCIQSRLALRMAETGDMTGAEEHYRRAYALMPASFGRVESHCFGCEGVFDGPFAQGIAEKVFSNLAKAQPGNAKVHYLLGYLLVDQGRAEDALVEFRESVKLDPEYLNAWNHIYWILVSRSHSAAELDPVQFAILKLDPLGRHSRFDINQVSDLKTAWNTLADVAKLQPGTLRTLYPLEASTASMAAREAATQRPARRRMPDEDDFNDARQKRDDPSRMIGSQELLQNITRIIQGILTLNQ
jgi:tetratricopeptide (TPR) repeat protein